MRFYTAGILKRLIILAPIFAGPAPNAAEFEVLDKFSVDGYSVLGSSAEVPGGSFTVGGSSFAVQYGKVGIGTSTPSVLLQISGSAGAAGDLVVISTGASGVIRMTGAGDIYANKFHGEADSLGDHTATRELDMAGKDIIRVSTISVSSITTAAAGITFSTNVFIMNGNVGIGTTGPVANLEVSGGIKPGDVASACTPGIAGTIRWTNSHLSVCNGSDWRQLDNQPPPTVSAIAPASGTISGGNTITISGAGFNLGLEVLIGGVAAAVTGVTGSQIIATTPPGSSSGSKEVKVLNTDGQYCLSAFTYNPLPTISTVSPASGQQSTVITIAGTGFVSGAGVMIGDTAATGVTWISAAQITATTPLSAAGGAKDVKVTNPDTGFVVKSSGFTYLVYATGGAESVWSGYRIHTFTASGTFTVGTGGNVEVLVVAGGGGSSSFGGGGGGGGGVITNSSYAVSQGAITVTVGAGGTAGVNKGAGSNGSDSIFGTLTAVGGGTSGNDAIGNGALGGSGGGAGTWAGTSGTGGSGTVNQGNAGGNQGGQIEKGGGGGGAGSAGTAGNTNARGGDGGAGRESLISGSSVYYGGGGGGGVRASAGVAGGNGGSGGGGRGDDYNAINGTSGTANTGGGGGGSQGYPYLDASGHPGGSGIVIIRYYY